jgi:hypothetical protein
MEKSIKKTTKDLWLPEKPAKLEANNLPTNGDILKHVFWLCDSRKTSIRESVIETAKFVRDIWQNIHIEVIVEKNVINFFSNIVEEFKLKRKNKHSPKHGGYKLYLDKLCDIANQTSVPQPKKLQKFLKDQRSYRVATISEISNIFLSWFPFMIY